MGALSSRPGTLEAPAEAPGIGSKACDSLQVLVGKHKAAERVTKLVEEEADRKASEKANFVVTVHESLSESGEFEVTCASASGQEVLPALRLPKENRYQFLRSKVSEHKGIPKEQVTLVSPNGDLLEKEHSENAAASESQSELKSLFTSVGGFAPVLQSGDVALLRCDWLVKFAEAGGALPMRQDLPEDAVWSDVDRLLKAQCCNPYNSGHIPIIVLSICWATPEHPDPNGDQIRALVPVFKKAMENYSATNCAVFLDWCSLFQDVPKGSRSEEDTARFERSIEAVTVMYASSETHVWRVTKEPSGVRKYSDCGWPTFDTYVSSLIKPTHLLIDVGLHDTEFLGQQQRYLQCNPGDCITRLCQSSRSPPALPMRFESELASKVFADETDPSLVMKKYALTFQAVTMEVELLFFDGFGWGDSEAEAVAVFLPSCTRLRFLRLDNNRIGDEGAVALAAGLLCRAGEEKPQGTKSGKGFRLSLSDNLIGDKGASALAQALLCKKLAELGLDNNPIGEDGKRALCDAGEEYGGGWVLRGAS